MFPVRVPDLVVLFDMDIIVLCLKGGDGYADGQHPHEATARRDAIVAKERTLAIEHR